MVFFQGKAAQDLMINIEQASLEQLNALRQHYTDKLRHNKTQTLAFKRLQTQLEAKKLELDNLKKTESSVEEEEKTRRQELKDVQEDQSADNYAARLYYLTSSPLHTYRQQLELINNTISKTSSAII